MYLVENTEKQYLKIDTPAESKWVSGGRVFYQPSTVVTI